MTRLASAIVGLLTTALLITGCAMLRALAVAQDAVTVLDALAVTPGGAAIAGEVVLATPLGPLSGGVPEHTVAFLAALTCPEGWVAHAAAQGRYVVGVPDGGTLAETVGTALTNREARSSGSHAHSFSDSDTISLSHTHGFSDSDTISFAHTHSFSDNINHSHSFSDTDSIAHSHGFSARTGGTTANHTHGYDRTGASTRSGSGSGSAAISALQFDDQTSNGASQTHQHDLSGTTGSGGGTVSISGTTGGGGGTSSGTTGGGGGTSSGTTGSGGGSDTVSISGTTGSGGGSATVDISGTTGSGGSSSTPAPYVQLLACRRVFVSSGLRVD